jgi:hypothetical protein
MLLAIDLVVEKYWADIETPSTTLSEGRNLRPSRNWFLIYPRQNSILICAGDLPLPNVHEFILSTGSSNKARLWEIRFVLGLFWDLLDVLCAIVDILEPWGRLRVGN